MEHVHLPIHPMVVHFPIALFISALGLEILSRAPLKVPYFFKSEMLHQCAWCNYILAVLATIAAVISALVEGGHFAHPVFYAHRALAWWTSAVGLLSLGVLFPVKRKSLKNFRILFFVFLVIMSFLIAVTAFYGGRLVYG